MQEDTLRLRSVPGRVYLAISDVSHSGRVRDALADLPVNIVNAGAIAALTEPVGSLNGASVLIIDSKLASAERTALLSLRQREPLLPIVLSLLPQDPLHRALPSLARMAIDVFVTLGSEPDEAMLRSEVLTRLTHALPASVLSLFDPVQTRVDLEECWCARNGFRPIRVQSVAAHFRLNRRTVYRDVVKDGWPDVEHLLEAARLMHVAAWLEASTLSLERIAEFLEFSSARAVRKLVVRFTKQRALSCVEAVPSRHCAGFGKLERWWIPDVFGRAA